MIFLKRMQVTWPTEGLLIPAAYIMKQNNLSVMNKGETNNIPICQVTNTPLKILVTTTTTTIVTHLFSAMGCVVEETDEDPSEDGRAWVR